jgi:hypothetical protein
MAFRLRMPAEIGAWLTDLAGSEPEAAAEVTAALMALMQAAAIPGQPLVSGDLERPSLYPDPDTAADPREALDLLYQHLLDGLQKTRREVADAATNRKRLEDALAASTDSALTGSLDRQLAAARDLEGASVRLAQRLQAMVDGFRTRKETAKATAVATEAIERIRQYADDIELSEPDPVPATEAASESAARVQKLLAEGRRLLAAVQDGLPTAAQAAAYRPEIDIFRLRADPLGSGALIFFAEEPVGTLTLLSVLADAAAVSEHHDAAADLAGVFLEEIRDDGWPAESLAFADPEVLAERLLPGHYPDLARRAAARAAIVTLTTLRERTGLSMARVAELTGLNEGRVKLLELQSPWHADVEVVAAYARALGGTLRLTVDLDGAGHIVG